MLALESKTLVVLATFGADYHSGQWSRLYRLQCRARSILELRGRSTWYLTDSELSKARRTRLYRRLVSKYGAE